MSESDVTYRWSQEDIDALTALVKKYGANQLIPVVRRMHLSKREDGRSALGIFRHLSCRRPALDTTDRPHPTTTEEQER